MKSKATATGPVAPKLFLPKFAIRNGRAGTLYQKNQLVYAQGGRANAFYYIRRGKVKLTVVSKEGKAVIGILGAGDFFGEACLAGQPQRRATAAALSDSLIVRLEKRGLFRVLHNGRAFSKQFLSYVLSRNIRLEEDLADQLFNSSEKRLARVLLLLANVGRKGKPEPVIPKISQETLAEIVGTTRARISFFMNRFRKLRFIDYNGKIKVYKSLTNVIRHKVKESFT